MVPTRSHRGGPPRKAMCYASVRRGVQKVFVLMLPIYLFPYFHQIRNVVVLRAIAWLHQCRSSGAVRWHGDGDVDV
jgi:hypothetical protein